MTKLDHIAYTVLGGLAAIVVIVSLCVFGLALLGGL